MTTIEKIIDNLTKVIFDVENSDHGDSGFQFYYGTYLEQGIEYEFSICVMHDKNSGSDSSEITWVDETPTNEADANTNVLTNFDWSEINDEHEQNEIELDKTMQKIRNENF